MAATESDVRSRQPRGRQAQGRGLGQKVGPLPLWAWIGGAVVVVYFLYRKAASGSQGANCPAGYVFDPNSNQCVQVASAATSGATTTTSQSPFPTIGGVFEPLQQQAASTSTTAPTPKAGQFYGEGYAGDPTAPGAVSYNAPQVPGGTITTAPVTYNGLSYAPVTQPAYWQWTQSQGLSPIGNEYPAAGLFYQPTPGVIAPAPNYVPVDTPLFALPGGIPGISGA